MKTIQTALAPLLIIGSFCSLSSEYPLGQSRRYFFHYYILAIWSFYVYFIYSNQSIIILTNYHFHQLVIWIIVVISIPISVSHSKELKMCLHELSIVDDTLEALGIPKEYQRLRNWIIRIIIGWIVFIFITEAVEEILNYTMHEANITVICVKFMINIPKYINLLNSLICGVIIRCTSSRFQRVNDCLHVLHSDLLRINTDCRRQNRLVLVRQGITAEANECKQYMWIIMHVHLQLYLISCKLNKIFNVQILLQMIPIFTFNVWMFCSMYDMYTNRDLVTVKLFIIIAYYYLHIIISNIIILTLNQICQTVYDEINNTVAILHELSNYNSDMALREQYYSSVLTVVVTLIQMDIYKYI